jgi:hypothetical protein
MLNSMRYIIYSVILHKRQDEKISQINHDGAEEILNFVIDNTRLK